MNTKEQIKFKIDYLDIEYKDFNDKKSVGRPIFDRKNERYVVSKLEWSFSIGSTTKEACNYAGISTSSLYRYLDKNPEFRDRIKVLKAKPMLLARKTVFDSLVSGDIKTAMWYAERKSPEFSLDNSMKFILNEKEERIKYLEDILRRNDLSF